MTLPLEFTSEEHLEDVMSTPSPMLINSLAQLEGDIIILGVAGKMGPTLARMAKRAAPHKRVIGVARFSNPQLLNSLSDHGIECIQADLLSAQALSALPDVPNVVFMAGRKFGSQGSEWLTWAMNAHVPALIAQRYQNSRIVAFSTACVYPFVDVHGPGAPESLAPTPPGEYANSCVARERMFEHFSHEHQTSGCLLRLSYAIDMRYGVLHDVARTIWQGLPLSVAMGYANIIWQGDANDLALRALSACTTPTSAINLSGPPISIRDVATRLAARMGKTVHLTDTEAPSAWLVDCHKADALWGPPSVALDTLLDWTAAWVMQGHKSLDKPTHFEVRDGHY